MIRIGVLVAYNSLEDIKPIKELLKDRCELTFFSYKKLSEIKQIYLDTYLLFDGIVMNHLAYLTLEKEDIKFQTPTFRYMPNESDFFRMLFKVSTSNRELDFSRVCFDYIGYPGLLDELGDVFEEDRFPYIIEGHLSDHMYEDVLQKHVELHNEKKIDLSITSFSNLVGDLDKLGIRSVHLQPTPKTITETFELAIKEIEYRRLNENRIVLGHISNDEIQSDGYKLNDSELNQMLLYTALLSFSKEHTIPLVIQRNNASFDISTSYKDLTYLTNSHKSDTLLAYVKEQVPYPVSIGWGIGRTFYEAQKKAKGASKLANQQPFQSVIMTEEEQVIKLAQESYLQYSNSVSTALHELSETANISTQQLQKIMSVMSKVDSNILSSEDVSSHLGITVRSANRMLKNLEDKGIAEPVFNKSEKLRGRPKKMYKIDLVNQRSEED